MGCTFCKIVSGELPCLKVYEDEYTVSFMDTAKDVDGHILVIPKKHVKSILDCDSDTLKHVISAVKKISNHLADSCRYDGVNLLNASGVSAGQSVPHFHIHLIPRKRGDGINAWPEFTGATVRTEEIYKKIKTTDLT